MLKKVGLKEPVPLAPSEFLNNLLWWEYGYFLEAHYGQKL